MAIFANLNTPYSIFTFTRWMSPNSLQPVQRKLRGIRRLRSRIRRVMIIYHHHSRGSAFGQRGLRLYYGLTGMRNCAPRFPYQFSPVRVNFENICDIICERGWLSLRGIVTMYHVMLARVKFISIFHFDELILYIIALLIGRVFRL